MAERVVNQNGAKSMYVEKNEGTIYVGDYVEEANAAFKDGSYELYEYAPIIDPPLKRPVTCPEIGLQFNHEQCKHYLGQQCTKK